MEQPLENVWKQCAKLLLPHRASGCKLLCKYIKQPYSEPHRHYHDLNHINALLVELEAYKQAQPKALERPLLPSTGPLARVWRDLSLYLAILFHDSVYNPASKVNEEDSVAWLRQFLSEAKYLCEIETHSNREGLASNSIAQVLWLDTPTAQHVEHEAARLIMGTKNHFANSHEYQATPELNRTNDPGRSTAFCREYEMEDLLALVLDLDLTVFGSPWESYVSYARKIRLEYEIYSDKVFMNSRYNFLQQVLDQPRIFKTRYFHDKYKEVAWENLKREHREIGKAIAHGDYRFPLTCL